MIPIACPKCLRSDCIAHLQLTRTAPAHWWQRIFGRKVRLVVTGHLCECPFDRTQFVVTLDGVAPLGAVEREGPPPPPEKDRPPREPDKPREWLRPPR